MSKKQKEALPNKSPVNIYFPGFNLRESGYLVGYRFEGSHFVISSIVSSSENLENLAKVLRTTAKLQAFNRYCASEP